MSLCFDINLVPAILAILFGNKEDSYVEEAKRIIDKMIANGWSMEEINDLNQRMEEMTRRHMNEVEVLVVEMNMMTNTKKS